MQPAPSATDVLDAGPRQAVPGHERFCVATGAVRPVDDMIRFVVAPDGRPVADLKRKLPGRGIWITGTRAALRTAIARKAFTRGFKRDVAPAPDLVESTERLLEQSALQALAMAHKAGRVAAGFGKTEAALAREAVVAVLRAAEAAPEGARKLDVARQNRTRDAAAEIAVVTVFTSTQLDLALGRSNVIHAALLAGRESDTFLARAARLARFRSDGTANSGTTDGGTAKSGATRGGATDEDAAGTGSAGMRTDRNEVDRASAPEEQERNG
jgi:predicted RNA-binding protein YlxR (DUF448 family)